jgi:hypothetical protein
VIKVGPKGYVHGWIYVGPQAAGSRVFHPHHGHGTVAHSDASHAHVEFDSGAKHSFDAAHRPTATAHHFEPRNVRPVRQRVTSPNGKLQGSLSTEERRTLDAGVKAAKSKMTPGQRKAVEQWTSGKGMVRKIQTGKVSADTARNFATAMQEAPKVDGLVYRGVAPGSVGAKFAESLRPGDKVSLGEPVSTSIEPKQSAGFGTYLFEIESPSAAYISGIGSKYTYEKEAVLAPGDFEVASVEDGKIGLGKHTAPVRIIRLRDTTTGSRSWSPSSGSDFAVTKANSGDDDEDRSQRFVQDDGPGQFKPADVARVVKVGPKGYIHGWVYVGPPDEGAEVHHPHHDKGTVTHSGGGKVTPYVEQARGESNEVQKVDEGAVGDFKARHLIRWYREGADGQIHWGQHGPGGDFYQCVAVASERMSSKKAKGFCANRHKEVTGQWPGAEHKSAGHALVKAFDPAEVRDDHGRWSVMGAVEHAVESAVSDGRSERRKPVDRLKLANRIHLDPGEHLVASAKVNGDGGAIRLAETEKDGTPSLRIGIGNGAFGSRDSEAGPWKAEPDDTAAVNAERAKLRDEQDRLGERWDEIQQLTIGEPAATGYARRTLSSSEQAELDAVEARQAEIEDESLGDVYADGYTAKLDAAATARLHSAITGALAEGLPVVAANDANWDEVDRIQALQEPLRGMRRKWTDEEDARWDALAAQLEAAEAKAQAEGSDYQIFSEGVIPGEWADVHYRVDLDDPSIGVRVHLGAVPHGSGQTLADLESVEESATLDPAETRQLLKYLAALG